MTTPQPILGWLDWAADLSPLPDFLLKATALLLVGWFTALMLRGRNPHWRVLLWRCVVASLVLLPVVSWLAPKVSLVVAGPVEKDLPGPSVIAAPSAQVLPPGSAGPLKPLPHPWEGFPPVASGPFFNIPLYLRTQPDPAAAVSPPRIFLGKSVEQANEGPGIRTWVWGIGALLLVLRLFWSHRRVRAFVRGSRPVPIAVVTRVREVARDLGVSDRVETRVSLSLRTPFLTGVFRPVLLLPVEMTEPEFSGDLSAVLAHELSHVRTNDLAWGWIFHLIGIALWPHPLLWRARKVHMTACEEVCDSVAARYIGSSESYSRVLARVAYALHSSAPAACGIAMARVSTVSRRLDALKRLVPVTPLARRKIAGALALASVSLLFVAALDFVRAEPASEQPSPEAAAGSPRPATPPDKSEVSKAAPTLRIRLVDKATQAILPDTTVEMRVNVSGGCNNYIDTPIRTGPVGEATLVSTATNPVAFGFRASVPGYVPLHGMWFREIEPRFARLPGFILLELEKGTRIGGIVKDEAGNPVSGAEVEISIYRQEKDSDPDAVRPNLSGLAETTDSEGRWSCAKLPEPLVGYNLSLSYSHPDYMLERAWNSAGSAEVSRLREGNQVVTLRRGASLSGRVVDDLGRPIEGATARTGQFSGAKESKTDSEGIFVLDHVPGHSTTLLVTADNYAPTVVQVAPTGKGAQFQVELKAGVPLRGRVQDEAGAPIPGAWISLDRSGFETLSDMLDERLETDSDGRFEWVNSPSRTLIYSITKKGFQGMRQLPLAPGEKEHLITLHPPIRVYGRVLDATTLEPIEEFQIIPGTQWRAVDKRVTWQESSGWVKNFRDGAYEFELNQGYVGMALQVKARGYLPAESPIIPRDAPRDFEQNFVLLKGGGPGGQILDLEGKPLAGAAVILCTTEAGGYIRNGLDLSNGSGKPVTTDSEGKFAFVEPAAVFKMVCVHEKGYAVVPPAEFPQGGLIRLQPWGRVEGRVFIGAKPAASEPVVLSFPDGGEREPRCYLDYRTTTDTEGRFAFEYVFPGEASAARQFTLASTGSGMRTANTHTPPVEVRPGETATVQVGGTGRPLIGKLKFSQGFPDAAKVQWALAQGNLFEVSQSRGILSALLNTKPKEPPRQRKGFQAKAEPDGSFRFEDIPEGTYNLIFTVLDPTSPDQMMGKAMGTLRTEITVPPMEGGRSDEPLDLGSLVVTPTKK
ncbi:MAG: hypothetical protein HUU16_04470 [Candidatus Omnitrophica bacterium]|nr:hypothetical protein [Candidatus Omnitrophota bacterium]